MPDGGNDPLVGAGGFHPGDTGFIPGTQVSSRGHTYRQCLNSNASESFRRWTTIFCIFLCLPPRAGIPCAVLANGLATTGGFHKDFNDVRRQARPADCGSPRRRFQR
jgi:hypothetical protein